MWKKMLLLSASIGLASCSSSSPLEQRYNLPRANLGEEPIEATHNPPDVKVGDLANPQPTPSDLPSSPSQQDLITGTWQFTTPSTTTRVERKSLNLQQFSIFDGRPSPTDKPIVVMTVTPPEYDKGSQAEADPTHLTTTGTRTYTLNGAIANEWTGRTSDGAAFCELILIRPGASASGGDICHAMAIARTEPQRKEALDILGSITWKPNAE